MTDERWLSRVRSLLAKAESTEFPDEAEALTAKAMELMAKYGVEEALLAASLPHRQTIVDRVITVSPPYISGKQTLAHIVASHLGCRTITIGDKFHLFGYAGDCERVEYLFTSLLVQIYTGLARAPRPAREGLRAFRHSWIAGFTSAVSTRLYQAARQAEAEAAAPTGVSVALVLADRGDQIEQRISEQYPYLKVRKRSSGQSRSGYDAGAAAGHNADLGGTRITRA
ncbi:DUF2786 domain-containing protein [Catelliglobosispora koreensis]|uniref:DUF2786 domain-containing protein n=1 Tax=Catelliglobosispora koreensis TaxID=129052 RepID=UPI0003673D6D|nr:DUF2786 domain-containing protein [Catelliglobosispora koreensis]